MDETLRLENQLCFPLYACARRVIGQYTPLLKPLNLTYTQYIVFLVLWDRQSITVRDLCTRLYLDSGTLTPVLKKMEAMGYLIRTRNSDDERVVTVSLTEEGLALKEKCRNIPLEMGKCVALSEQEIVSLYGILYKILGQLDQEEEKRR